MEMATHQNLKQILRAEPFLIDTNMNAVMLEPRDYQMHAAHAHDTLDRLVGSITFHCKQLTHRHSGGAGSTDMISF